MDTGQHPVNVQVHIGIPDTDDQVTARLQIGCTGCVVIGIRGLLMLRAIQFNDEQNR